MTVLNLPSFDYKIKKEKDRLFIFDIIRKRYIALTPEEWVRQHFVSYLISYKGYPLGLIGNEISLRLNGQNRRCDTVIYDIYGSPLMIIEYKAPHISFYMMVMAIAVPIMIQNGLTNFVNLLDNIMVGRLGTEEMSGVRSSIRSYLCIIYVFSAEQQRCV